MAGIASSRNHWVDERMILAGKHPKRRLLFLLPAAPRFDATDGGRRAMAQLISALAKRHEIALLYLRASDEQPLEDNLKAQCSLVEEIVRPGNDGPLARRLSRGLRLVAAPLTGNPMWSAAWSVAEYRARLRLLVHTWQPDIVQIEFHIMGQYISALNGCAAPRVLTEHEPGAAAAKDKWQSQQGLKRAGYYLDWIAWEQFEKAIIEQVQTVVVFTERDRQAIAKFARQTPIVCIPLGTELPQEALNPLGSQPLSLIFIGNFKHPPNVGAAARLVSEIFPLIQARFPELTLYVVGDQPPPRISRMANEKVIITGRVPDVAPYLDRAAIVVVPLSQGGGMRVKVLEALAFGKAVVASPLAVEGLSVTDKEQVVMAESNQQFCESIGQLLADRERRASLAARAREWACTNLGWERSIEAYEMLYESLLK